jgi:membrane-bound serine protease (ClpP class)
MKKTVLLLLFLFTSVLFASGKIYTITIDGGISPATARYIEKAIAKATEENATALIIKLNTPGGLLESTRDIVGYIMESNVPVIVYVSPSGARAGSAGVFITLSAHIAAMAPGTNIGAAHPVGIQGEADSSVMFEKVTNDAAAFIRTIAEKRNRNISWAERTVRNSIASTEKEALDSGAVDFICNSVDELLQKAEGKTIVTKKGIVTMHFLGKETEDLEMSWIEELLLLISDPSIAYILLMIGFYGIMFELYSPGAILPGVAGAICLILGLYSMNTLPINYAGAGLIIVAIILFLLEIKVTSYGILSIGGVIALFLGSMMLIDSPFEFMKISLSVIITMVVVTLLFFTFIISMAVKAQQGKKHTGIDSLIGETGIVIIDIDIDSPGKIKIMGELWNAVSDTAIEKDSIVKIEEISGLTLKVKKL